MRTPAGAECTFYYEDFARGLERQECRARKAPGSATWRPADCVRCPVPSILAANGSPYLDLLLSVRPGVLGIGRHIAVTARCSLHGAVADPVSGCPACNAEANALLRDALR